MASLLDLDDLDELDPLEPSAPEERWQEHEIIPVLVDYGPGTTDGFTCKLVSHIDLQRKRLEQATLLPEPSQNVVSLEMGMTGGPDGESCNPGSSGVPKPSGTAAVFHRKPKTDACVGPSKNSKAIKRKRWRKLRAGSNEKVVDLRTLITGKNAKTWPRGNEKVQRLRQECEGTGRSCTSFTDPCLPNLSEMNHIVFLDLDNCPSLNRWNSQLPPKTYVLGFYGKGTHFKPPRNCQFYDNLIKNNCFYLHPQCGSTKDAADFAICTKAGKLDNQLPKSIPFTVVSGDRGFLELQNQMDMGGRVLQIVDPHSTGLDTIFNGFYGDG